METERGVFFPLLLVFTISSPAGFRFSSISELLKQATSLILC